MASASSSPEEVGEPQCVPASGLLECKNGP